jgi:hypothetical protein
MRSARNRLSRTRLSSGREAIEVRVASVEPARGKDQDEVITSVSAAAWAKAGPGRSAAICSSSSFRATTRTAQHAAARAEASTPGLRSKVHRCH